MHLARRYRLNDQACLATRPIHASYREDPTSTLTESLLASATAQLRSSRTRSKP